VKLHRKAKIKYNVRHYQGLVIVSNFFSLFCSSRTSYVNIYMCDIIVNYINWCFFCISYIIEILSSTARRAIETQIWRRTAKSMTDWKCVFSLTGTCLRKNIRTSNIRESIGLWRTLDIVTKQYFEFSDIVQPYNFDRSEIKKTLEKVVTMQCLDEDMIGYGSRK
jgi:hypothetical protein